eukprot:7701980-Alexandrium_andersonii.AAC.1
MPLPLRPLRWCASGIRQWPWTPSTFASIGWTYTGWFAVLPFSCTHRLTSCSHEARRHSSTAFAR